MAAAAMQPAPAGLSVSAGSFAAGKGGIGGKPPQTDPSGRYSKHELIGQGAQKKVFKGFDEEDGIEVAWNEVSVADLANFREKDRQRVFAEIRVLKALKHKNIMSMHDYWYDDKRLTLNFITEMFPDGTLRQYRRRHKHADVMAIKRWAWQILQGLVYLHGHNPPIIHRDLKCDNIFVDGSSGIIKIGDLGLATLCKDFSAPQSVLGTPEFMAPELYEEKYDERVDVYAFGMCVLELVTMDYPYSECKNAAQIYKKVMQGIPPASLEKVQSAELREFITTCLQADPARRPEARQLLKHPFFEEVRAAMQPAVQLGGGSHHRIAVSPSLSATSSGTLPSLAADAAVAAVMGEGAPGRPLSRTTSLGSGSCMAAAAAAAAHGGAGGVATMPGGVGLGRIAAAAGGPSPPRVVGSIAAALRHSSEPGVLPPGPPRSSSGGSIAAAAGQPPAGVAGLSAGGLPLGAMLAGPSGSSPAPVPPRGGLSAALRSSSSSGLLHAHGGTSRPSSSGSAAPLSAHASPPLGLPLSYAVSGAVPTANGSSSAGPPDAAHVWGGMPYIASSVSPPAGSIAAALAASAGSTSSLGGRPASLRAGGLSPASSLTAALASQARAVAEAEQQQPQRSPSRSSSGGSGTGGLGPGEQGEGAGLGVAAAGPAAAVAAPLQAAQGAQPPARLQATAAAVAAAAVAAAAAALGGEALCPAAAFNGPPGVSPTNPFGAAGLPAIDEDHEELLFGDEDGSRPHGMVIEDDDDLDEPPACDLPTYGAPSMMVSQPVSLAVRNPSKATLQNMALSFAMSFTNHKGVRKRVGFQYDLLNDTATGLATEMVENLSLNTSEAETLARMIQHEVARVTRQQGEAGLQPAAGSEAPGA